MSTNKIFIPYYVSNANVDPASVLPRMFFYNGLKTSDGYYIQYYDTFSAGYQFANFAEFPYFDNYSGQTTTTSSLSLLFLNEDPAYGTEIPSQSLYDRYWAKYVDLLYNPRTRIIRLGAVLPFAVYNKLELNDIIQLRSNYYHLRAINDYNLRTGECKMELLGPLLEGALNLFPTYYSTQISAEVQRNNCSVGYTGSLYNVVLPASYSVSTASQEDAQSTAQAYFNSISQSEANASGSCIFNSSSYFYGNFSVGNSADNRVTTSMYPVTLSLYSTSASLPGYPPSYTSSQWQLMGYLSNSLYTPNQTFDSMSIALQVSYSGYPAFYTIKAQANDGTHLTPLPKPFGGFQTTGSNDFNFYSYGYYINAFYTLSFQNVDIISAPKLNQDYTQSYRLPGDVLLNFVNGNAAAPITSSISGPLTMSWMVTSSTSLSPTSYPTWSDARFTPFCYFNETTSSAEGRVNVYQDNVFVTSSNYVIISSSLYNSATDPAIYFLKMTDAGGNPIPMYYGGGQYTNQTDITIPIGASPDNLVRRLRVSNSGSATIEQSAEIYWTRV